MLNVSLVIMCMLIVYYNYSHSLSVVIDVVKQLNSLTQRQYQIAVPNFWPGKLLSINWSSIVFALIIASQVTVDKTSFPYCPLRDAFNDYDNDCWSYDGRYK